MLRQKPMQLIRLLASALLPALILTACASGYTPSNLIVGFGYTEEKGPGQLIKVSYVGRDDTVYMAAHYVLYRSAEIAQRERKPYFALYQDLPAALADRRSEKSLPGTADGKAHSFAYIVPFEHDAPGLLSAAEVLRRLGPKVKGSAP